MKKKIINECETGNTWLIRNGRDHYLLFKTGDNKWLEVCVVPGNYPGIYAKELVASTKALSRHVEKLMYDGWSSRRVNIPICGFSPEDIKPEVGNV